MTNKFKQQLNKLKTQRKLLIAIIFALVAVVVWIGVSIIASQQKLGVTPEMKQLAQPLTPNLNEKVLVRIKNKRVFTSEQLKNFSIFGLVENEDGTDYSLVNVVEGEVVRSNISSQEVEMEANTEPDLEEATDSAQLSSEFDQDQEATAGASTN
jgi:hypothetical protein